VLPSEGCKMVVSKQPIKRAENRISVIKRGAIRATHKVSLPDFMSKLHGFARKIVPI